MQKEKIVLFIVASKDFRDEEYLEPKKILQSAGIKVITASTKLGKIFGMLGASAEADILIDKVEVDEYDAIIFVGGIGASEYWDNKTAHKIANEAFEKSKIVGAICIAPVTLANAGILKNKKATVFPTEQGRLRAKGAIVTDNPVEIDQNIITGKGPEAAGEFGEKLKQLLLK